MNDMAPWPERAEYEAAVTEHCAAGTHVARVHAVDSDASRVPAKLRYSIVAGNPDGLFSIDEETGKSKFLIIGTTLQDPFESYLSYNLYITKMNVAREWLDQFG